MGYEARSGGTTAVAFAVAFDTALVSVSVTTKRNSATNDYAGVVYGESTSGFNVLSNSTADGYYWIAMGY